MATAALFSRDNFVLFSSIMSPIMLQLLSIKSPLKSVNKYTSILNVGYRCTSKVLSWRTCAQKSLTTLSACHVSQMHSTCLSTEHKFSSMAKSPSFSGFTIFDNALVRYLKSSVALLWLRLALTSTQNLICQGKLQCFRRCSNIPYAQVGQFVVQPMLMCLIHTGFGSVWLF